MSDSERPQKKKRQPSWLTGGGSDTSEISEDTGGGEEQETTATGTASGSEHQPGEQSAKPGSGTEADKISGGRGRRGASAEEDTDEMPTARRIVSSEPGSERAPVPRVKASGAGGSRDDKKSRQQESGIAGVLSPANILRRARANPAPILLSALILAVLAVIFWFLFLSGGGEEAPANNAEEGGDSPGAAQSSPSAGGIDETGIVFSGLQENSGEASLQGAGLEWTGSVVEKQGGAGATLTLEGPTAAQIERGFEVQNSDVESGVYALAQDDGSVIHVATHTYQLVAEQQDDEDAEQVEQEITLGTIFDLKDGSLSQSGFYVDRHENDSPEVLRTYYPGPELGRDSSYEVAFNAPQGTPVPLLVGYRGNDGEDPNSNQQGD